MCRSVMLLLLYLGGTYEVQYVLEVCAEHEKLPASAGWLAGLRLEQTGWTKPNFPSNREFSNGAVDTSNVLLATLYAVVERGVLAWLGWLAGWLAGSVA